MTTDEQLEKLLPLMGDDVAFSIATLDETYDDIHSGLVKLLEMCGENTDRDGLQDTPYRFIKAMLEHTAGYREDPDKHLEKTFDVDHRDLVLVKDIPFNSLCEHHLAPFVGKVHIAYIPKDKITGLSKFGRLVEGYSKRLQVQERLTQQLADAVEKVLEPLAVAVIVEAEHTCMSGRGVRKHGASTVTSTMRGEFENDSALRAELMQLIRS